MSQPHYKPGDRVHTPAYGEGVIVTVNKGPVRGRMWREVSYSVRTASTPHAVVYFESELASPDGDGR